MSEQKEKLIGVDFTGNTDIFYRHLGGKVYSRDDVRRLMEKFANAGITTVVWRTASAGLVTYRSKVRTRVDRCTEGAVPISFLPGDTSLYHIHTGCNLSDGPYWVDILEAYDPPEAAVAAARELGLKIYLYTTLFDEGDTSSECDFCRDHPEFCWRHRHYGHFNRGLLAYGHEEVREYKLAEVKELLDYESDGVYLDCARSHSGAWPLMCIPYGYDVYANYGFNDPECEEYERRSGSWPRLSDPGRIAREPIDWKLWQKVRGSFLSRFIRDARQETKKTGQKLGVGFYTDAACYLSPAGERGRQILGGIDIDCGTWIDENLMDFVIVISEHRRFGWPDWENHSAAQFEKAQKKGIEVFVWAATENAIDELPDAPVPFPIRIDKDPDLFLSTVSENVRRTLQTTADGVYMYEAANIEGAEVVRGLDYWGYLKRALTC